MYHSTVQIVSSRCRGRTRVSPSRAESRKRLVYAVYAVSANRIDLFRARHHPAAAPDVCPSPRNALQCKTARLKEVSRWQRPLNE